MEVYLLNSENQEFVISKIERADIKDMPYKKNGWQFSWKSLYKIEGAEIFKLTLLESPKVVEGLVMLSLMYGEMLYMNNIEVAPHNIGKQGKYDHAAGILIAFGCHKSFEEGKGNYTGFLTFESKTELIPLYQKKYGAILAKGHRMFFEPEVGIKLIDKYLGNHGEEK